MEPSLTTKSPELEEASSGQYKKFWIGGIPPRTQKDTIKLSFAKGFNITDQNVIDEIQVIVKLGYGFVTIPSIYSAPIM